MEARGYYNAPKLEEDIDCWVKSVRSFLKCFGQHLSGEIIAQIDNNDPIKAEEISKECLPNGYQKIQYRFGDLLFERGKRSWEPGYWDDDDGPLGSWDA